MKNCKTCEVDLAAYKGDWSKLPCLTCPNMRDYNRLFGNYTEFFDTGDSGDEESAMVASLEDANDPVAILAARETIDETTIPAGFTLEQFIEVKNTIEQALTRRFAGSIIGLLRLAKESPVMFEVVLKKLYFPYMSYADIGESLNPPCSKQNVLYHLKHAITLFPELCTAMHIDTRYSGGSYALTSLAARTRKRIARDRLTKIMYGDNAAFKEATEKEIKALVGIATTLNSSILDFDPYVKYAERDRQRRQDKLEREIPDFRGINTEDTNNGKAKHKNRRRGTKAKGAKS